MARDAHHRRRAPLGVGVRDRDRLAADGVAVSRSLAGSLIDPDAPFAADPGLARDLLPGREARAVGRHRPQPCARSHPRTLADDGPDALYGGPVGEAYAAGLPLGRIADRPTTTSRAHEASVLAPLRARFRDWHVSVVPPNSQGFVLLQILSLLERLGIDPDLDGADAGRIARVIDAANMDRDRHLADADRMPVHPSTLLDDAHLAALADEPPVRERPCMPTATRSPWSRPTPRAMPCR